MSAETLSQPPSVKDSFLAIAHDICMAERGVSIPYFETRTWIDWQGAPDIFNPVLALKRVFIQRTHNKRFEILTATFELPDEDISVSIDKKITADLNGDLFLLDILEKFKTYPLHSHTTCLQRAPKLEKTVAVVEHKTTDKRGPHARNK